MACDPLLGSTCVWIDDFGYLVSSDNFTSKTSDYGMIIQRRLTLDHDGNVRVYSIKDGQDKWSVSGIFRRQPCFIHGICGEEYLSLSATWCSRNCYKA